VARKWILAYPADTEILVLAHTSEAATDFLLSTVSLRGSWFGIKRLTLNLLASRMAQRLLVARGIAPASYLSFTAVVARAIHSLQAAGRLSYFAPVSSRPGFPVAVAKTLAELRMNEIQTDSLARLARGGGDLAAIYDFVEAELDQSNLSDRAALYRTAIDSLGSRDNASYVGLPILILDVPVHTRLESRYIRELVSFSPSVLALVPFGDTRTISALDEFLEVGERDSVGEMANSLAFAKHHLFENSAPAINQLDQSLHVNSWPGEPRECIEIVRSIQAEAGQGVPFDQIAVLLNSPGEYRSHLEEAFGRARIPVYFAQGSTAPDPAGRALLALLSCAAEGLSARGFAEYLSLGQVPYAGQGSDRDLSWVGPEDELVASTVPEETVAAHQQVSLPLFPEPQKTEVIEGSLRAPARWERLLVDSAVIGGKDRWSRRLEGLENELQLCLNEIAPEEEARVESIKKQLRDLGALKSYALPLIEKLATLPERADWKVWLDQLRDLAISALRYPEGVLGTLADLEQMGMVGPVDLYEVQLVLGPRLRDLGVKPTSRRYGSVYVGSVDSARGLSFQVVFVPGLAERVFPRKLVEDPILPDEQRLQTSVPGLSTRRDQLELERLALRMAVGAARDRAYLSYPRIDVQQSRPRVPSFYALEALRAAEGVLPGFEEIAARAESTTRARLGWPAPENPELAIDEAEYDLAVLASLVEAKREDVTGRAHYLLTANAHLARALRGRSRRWLRRWTSNDGLVDPDEIARRSLAKHQFSARSFSATALQNYSSCPYKFFLSAILRFELRQEPAAIEAIDPLTRGSLFHEAQFEILTKLKAAGLLPLRRAKTEAYRGAECESDEKPEAIDIAFDLVDRALDRLAYEYEDKLAPAIPRVWQDGINSIRADLREWLRRMLDVDDGWVPEKYELSFGLTDRGPRNCDPDSVPHPVEVIGDLKLRGSIDLVERHPDGNYRVTDHKTGKARAPKDTVVGEGKYLQPLLYALATQKLLKQPVESGRLYYCTADGGFEERVVTLNEDHIQILNTVLIAIRQALADGFLPAAPEEGGCNWCDFLAVCGSFEETRTSAKPSDRLVQLQGLRKLP